jgi:CHAT domain-containing protein
MNHKFFLLLLYCVLIAFSPKIVAQDLNKLQEIGNDADRKNFKGLEYYMDRDYGRAAKMYEEVIALCEELKKMVGANPDFEKKMDNVIIDKLMASAECYQMLSNLEMARDHYIRAGTLAEKYGELTRKLKILCNLATMARESSDFKQFILYYSEVEKSLAQVREVDNLPAAELISWADVVNRYRLLSIERSSLLFEMGKVDEALKALDNKKLVESHKALCKIFTADTFGSLFESVKKSHPEEIEDILNIIYVNIKSQIYLTGYRGQYLRAKGDYNEALAQFDITEKYLKSLDLHKIDGNYIACISYLRDLAHGAEPSLRPVVDASITKLSKFKDEEIDLEYRAFMIENEIRRAQTYKAMGDYKKAIDIFRSVERELEKLDNYRKTKIPLIFSELGEIYFLKKDYARSLDCAGKAESSLALSPLDFSTPWKTYALYGKLHEQAGEKEKAYGAYRKAIDYIEKLHSLLYIGRRREEFFGERVEPYEGIIRVLVGMGKPAEAVLYVEKAKARSLSEHFGATILDSNMAPEDRKKMRTSFHELNRKLRESEESGSGDRALEQKRALDIEEKLQKMTGDLRTLSSYKGMLDDYANYVCAATISAEDAMKLNDGSSVILEFFYDTCLPEEMRHMYLFVITPDIIKAMTLSIPPAEAESRIRSLRRKISRNDAIWREEASILYQRLIEPAESLVAGRQRLIVVPHRVLHYLPFSALVGKEGKPLIEEHSVIYSPSLTALKFCRDKSTPAGNTIVSYCLGNLSVAGFTPLPGTLSEVHEIATLFKGGIEIKEKEFTRERVYRELAGRNYVHFATHGVVDADNPGNSGLITSDGILTVEDILDSKKFKLSSHIVTLSACNTGLGKLFPGDEQEGLTRAFMFAGTPSVLSTLWSIDDESTAKLMGYFYRNLLSTMDKDEALRQAEIRLMKEYPGPIHWAPFILTGYWKN